MYVGEFARGRRHGNGVRISGEKRHGMGYLMYANGDALNGDW